MLKQIREIFPKAEIHVNPEEIVVYIPYSLEDEDAIKQKIVALNVPIGGLHTYMDKSEAYMIRLPKRTTEENMEELTERLETLEEAIKQIKNRLQMT